MKIISSMVDEVLDPNVKSKTVGYTCDPSTKKINMDITEVPEEARRLILIVEDPKDPKLECKYCVVWNALETGLSPFRAHQENPEIKKDQLLEEDNPHDDVPQTDFYEVLCKPGKEIYRFKVYALDNEPKMDKRWTAKELQKMMEGHILDSVEITAYCKN